MIGRIEVLVIRPTDAGSEKLIQELSVRLLPLHVQYTNAFPIMTLFFFIKPNCRLNV